MEPFGNQKVIAASASLVIFHLHLNRPAAFLYLTFFIFTSFTGINVDRSCHSGTAGDADGAAFAVAFPLASSA